jgi:hypothetical protein
MMSHSSHVKNLFFWEKSVDTLYIINQHFFPKLFFFNILFFLIQSQIFYDFLKMRALWSKSLFFIFLFSISGPFFKNGHF